MGFCQESETRDQSYKEGAPQTVDPQNLKINKTETKMSEEQIHNASLIFWDRLLSNCCWHH